MRNFGAYLHTRLFRPHHKGVDCGTLDEPPSYPARAPVAPPVTALGLPIFIAGAEALRILAGRSSSETAIASAVRPARHSRLRFGDGWQFDCETLRLKYPAGDDVELTMMELALLRAFIVQATRIRGTDVTRSLDGIIHRLRRKLPGIIQTRRGEGYIFAVPVESV
jgi:hypothetical protein